MLKLWIVIEQEHPIGVHVCHIAPLEASIESCLWWSILSFTMYKEDEKKGSDSVNNTIVPITTHACCISLWLHTASVGLMVLHQVPESGDLAVHEALAKTAYLSAKCHFRVIQLNSISLPHQGFR